MIKKTTLISLFCLYGAGSAFAAPAISTNNDSRSLLIIGGNVGYTMPTGNLKGKDDSIVDMGVRINEKAKNGNIAGGVFLGYEFIVNDMFNVGTELHAQYAHDVTKMEYSAAGMDNQNFSVAFISIPLFITSKFYIPHAYGVNLFTKAGYAFNRAFLKTKGDGVEYKFRNEEKAENLWRPVVAAGIGYQIDKYNVAVTYQYNWLPSGGENQGFSTISFGCSLTMPV